MIILKISFCLSSLKSYILLAEPKPHIMFKKKRVLSNLQQQKYISNEPWDEPSYWNCFYTWKEAPIVNKSLPIVYET